MQESHANDSNVPTELDLNGIREIVLWDPANWVGLLIHSSEHPGCKISGDETMVGRYRWWRNGSTLYLKLGGRILDRITDALTTSLTRKHIQVEILIGSLERVKATGMVEIDLTGWDKAEPEILLYSPTTLWRSRFSAM